MLCLDQDKTHFLPSAQQRLTISITREESIFARRRRGPQGEITIRIPVSDKSTRAIVFLRRQPLGTVFEKYADFSAQELVSKIFTVTLYLH